MIGAVLAALLLADGPGYDALVAEGIAVGKAGRLVEARALFDRAASLDPTRPEALVERGGVRFLEGSYDAAVVDLRAALRRKDDEYARDLLASALHLAGRPDDALAEWNRLGRPTLRTLTVGGLEKTRDRVARRELAIREGLPLRLDDLRRSRLQLREAGAFDRATLHTIPLAAGQADVEVALVERHGFARGWLDFAIASGVATAQRRAPLRYANLGGLGIGIGAEYRWQENRPQASAGIDWPRPFGLGAYLRVEGFRGRQLYEVGGESLAHRRGFAFGLRRVLAPATVGELRFRLVTRRFDLGNPQAEDGRVSGIQARLDQRLVEERRVRLDTGIAVFGAARGLGSDFEFARVVARVGATVDLSQPDGKPIERSSLAVQVIAGVSGDATPFDEAFAVGASPQMDLPLRGHRQAEDGVLGGTPLARRLVLGNLEWRQRIVNSGPVQAGVVLFYDAATLEGVYQAPSQTFHDVGFGLRMGFPGTSVLRLDYGRGLADGRDTLSIGLGHAF